MLKPFAVALNLHDHNTYDGSYHNQRERITRFKHNLPYHAEAYAHQSDILNPEDYRLNDEFIKIFFNDTNDIMNIYSLVNKGDVLAFTYTYGGIRKSKEHPRKIKGRPDENRRSNENPTNMQGKS